VLRIRTLRLHKILLVNRFLLPAFDSRTCGGAIPHLDEAALDAVAAQDAELEAEFPMAEDLDLRG
jgi:hypothetical protein